MYTIRSLQNPAVAMAGSFIQTMTWFVFDSSAYQDTNTITLLQVSIPVHIQHANRWNYPCWPKYTDSGLPALTGGSLKAPFPSPHPLPNPGTLNRLTDLSSHI